MFFVLFFTACNFEKVVEVGEIAVDPHLVINGLIYAGADTTQFYVTESRTIYNPNNWYSGPFRVVHNADLSLSLNNEIHKLSYNKEDSTYIFVGCINARQKVSIESTYNKQHVSSSVVLPDAPDATLVDTIHFEEFNSLGANYYILFHVKLKDKPNTKDFYRLIVTNSFSYEDEVYGNSVINETAYSNDPLLAGTFKVFRDISFDGKEYTLSFYVNDYSKQLETTSNSTWKLEVALQTISEDLYKYYTSLQRSSENQWNETEPVLIHSNIVGGLGIFGACNEINLFKYKNF